MILHSCCAGWRHARTTGYTTNMHTAWETCACIHLQGINLKVQIFTHMAWHGAERDCYETVKLSYTIIFSNGECWSPSLLLLIHFPCHDHLCLQFIVHQHLLWFHRLINFVPKPSFIVFASLASLLASYFYRAFLHFFLILTHHRPIGKIPLSSMDLHAPTTSTSHYAQTISVVA
jgi:hypothetical protein